MSASAGVGEVTVDLAVARCAGWCGGPVRITGFVAATDWANPTNHGGHDTLATRQDK